MLSNKSKSFLDGLTIGQWAEDSLPHKLFLYGPPKAGKTSLALSSGTPTLHISTEPSANVLRNKRMEAYRGDVDTISFTDFDQLLALFQGIYEGHPAVSKYQNVVIDTQDGINTMFLTQLNKEKSRDPRQDYNKLLNAWYPVIYYMSKLSANVTVIAHEKALTDSSGGTLGTVGNVSEGVRKETMSKLDTVGRLTEINGARKISFKKTGQTPENGSRGDLDGQVISVDTYWDEIRAWETKR